MNRMKSSKKTANTPVTVDPPGESAPQERGGTATAHGPDPAGHQGTGNPMIDERGGCKPLPIDTPNAG